MSLRRKIHTQGTLKVDFAGTREEAKEFIKVHSEVHSELRVGNEPNNIGNEGLPMIVTRYNTNKHKSTLLELLASLGWDNGSVIDTPLTVLRGATTRGTLTGSGSQ